MDLLAFGWLEMILRGVMLAVCEISQLRPCRIGSQNTQHALAEVESPVISWTERIGKSGTVKLNLE